MDMNKMQFAIRGLVEGFYGNPWTWEMRLSVIPRLARLGFNAYFYGPKDEPLVCARWRDPYQAADLARLRQLKEACDQSGMDLVCMLAPCFSMVFSSASDFEALMDKYRQLYSLGIQSFVLLFDDVPEELQDPEDQAQFGTLLSAHIDLALRTYAALKEMDPDIRFMVCPTEYWGDGSKGYLGPFGQAMPPDVAILYTGYTICAHELNLDNAQHFQALTGKKPLYWDNYPVNDANMTREFHIAPIINRAPDLALHAEGLVVNPMEYQESSMLALFTFGEYLNDGAAYDPEASFARAVSHLLGAEHLAGASALRELCYRSVLTRHGEQFPEDDPEAGRHWEFLALVEAGSDSTLQAWAQQRAASLMKLEDCDNQAFLTESARWRKGALRFLQGVQQLDAQLLREYLADDPEDIMLHEARRLLDRLQQQDMP